MFSVSHARRARARGHRRRHPSREPGCTLRLAVARARAGPGVECVYGVVKTRFCVTAIKTYTTCDMCGRERRAELYELKKQQTPRHGIDNIRVIQRMQRAICAHARSVHIPDHSVHLPRFNLTYPHAAGLVSADAPSWRRPVRGVFDRWLMCLRTQVASACYPAACWRSPRPIMTAEAS